VKICVTLDELVGGKFLIFIGKYRIIELVIRMECNVFVEKLPTKKPLDRIHN